MNYYEHHIGDFDQATAHLTACEDGMYSRLIRRYYATEKPLPAEVSVVQRLVRARTNEEKRAAVDMLNEFFVLQEDGWHQPRCDEEIAQYHAGGPDREIKKANEDNRLKRHREERSRLFKALTDAGQYAPWNIGMNELRGLVEKLATACLDKPATAPATPATETATAPATAPATPATATQTPVPNHQTPITRHQTPDVMPVIPTPSPPAGESPPAAKKANGKSRETPMPADFSISDRVKAWAEKHGFDHLEAHYENFKLQCESKGYTYINWDSAFMKAIAKDWAELRKGAPATRDLTALIAKLEAADEAH